MRGQDPPLPPGQVKIHAFPHFPVLLVEPLHFPRGDALFFPISCSPPPNSVDVFEAVFFWPLSPYMAMK